ncbi:MAG: DUF1549 domain-containing protein, partial [Phycisphaerae bacterium]|nr:DUF1549 domain-containing protein [Phycisphaerae bacterium]
MNPRLLLFALLLVSSAADGLVAAQPPAEIDFARQIAPVFQGHCIKCHGAEKQKGKFRLDRRANMLRGGDSAEPAIVPGDPKASYLLKLIRHEEADLEMPAEGDPLSAGQVALIERWIAEGALTPDSYGPDVEAIATDHWSMQPLEAPSVPSGEAHSIDAFVAAKHRKHGLAFNPRATRRDLVRRMFLDMTGLLPTPEERARFESADVAQLAEYLLASPHYGERWARHWLDVVRFAESAGFETNLERPNAYHYRDYIIRAFNDDKPYNDFVFEQLAGDTVGEDAATGFIVGGAYDKVKGQDKLLQKMQRQDELSDMVSTTATAFLGLTMGCAKCHNHKFDPVSQTDFFAMASVFQGVQHGDRLLKRKDEAARKARAAALQGKIARIRNTLESYRPPRPAGSTVMIDDRDQGRTRHLAEKRGHGTNPGGKQRGHKDDAGGLDRLPNLSGG